MRFSLPSESFTARTDAVSRFVVEPGVSPEHCLCDEGQFPPPPGPSRGLMLFVIRPSCFGGTPNHFPTIQNQDGAKVKETFI